VYLVGGGTHPGSGLPVIYEGARISTDLLLQDLGMARSERSPRHMRASAGAFSSQVGSLGGSENATRQAFSSQAVPLGGSENATKKQER
jgi:hypothetical protein